MESVATYKSVRVMFLIAIGLLLIASVPKIRSAKVPWYRDNDFAHYYLTAQLVAQGKDPYIQNLLPLYELYQFTPQREIAKATNPPALAILTLPLVKLPADSAFKIWSLLQLLSLFSGVLISLWLVGLRTKFFERVALLIAALAPYGSFAHFAYGQGQAVILLMIMFGLQLLTSKVTRDRNLGAIIWGVATSLKLFTYPLAFVLFLYQGKKSLLWFACGFLLLHIPFVLICGFDAILSYVREALPYVQLTAAQYNGNISLSSAFVYTARVIFDTISLDRFALFLLNLGSISLLFWILYNEYREKASRPGIITSSCVVLTASLLFAPTCWPHYIPLLFGALLLVLRYSLESWRTKTFCTLLVFNYLFLGTALGFLSREPLPGRIISAWWGPISLSMTLVLLLYARRTSRTEII